MKANAAASCKNNDNRDAWLDVEEKDENKMIDNKEDLDKRLNRMMAGDVTELPVFLQDFVGHWRLEERVRYESEKRLGGERARFDGYPGSGEGRFDGKTNFGTVVRIPLERVKGDDIQDERVNLETERYPGGDDIQILYERDGLKSTKYHEGIGSGDKSLDERGKYQGGDVAKPEEQTRFGTARYPDSLGGEEMSRFRTLWYTGDGGKRLEERAGIETEVRSPGSEERQEERSTFGVGKEKLEGRTAIYPRGYDTESFEESSKYDEGVNVDNNRFEDVVRFKTPRCPLGSDFRKVKRLNKTTGCKKGSGNGKKFILGLVKKVKDDIKEALVERILDKIMDKLMVHFIGGNVQYRLLCE